MDAEASEPPKKRERDHDDRGSVEDHDDADGYSLKRTKLDAGGDDGENNNNNHNKSNGHAEVQIADHEEEEPDQASIALNPPREEDDMSTTKAPPSSKSLHPVAVALSPAVTRSRASEKSRTNGTSVASENNDETAALPGDHSAADTGKRWRVHQMAEDYMDLAGNMMYPATQLRPYGYDADRREYPLEGMSLLGYLKSSIRRPSVIEKWSPHEIALFEAALFHYGKEFHLVSKIIQTKSTKDTIDFYYIWKKTSHYTKWKSQFVPSSDLADIESSPVKGGKL